MKVFLTVLILAILVFATPIQFTLPDGNPLMINSSFTKDTFSVSLSSQGRLNSKFTLTSKALYPQHGSHELIHSDLQLELNPPIDEQKILFNSYDQSEYWLAIKQPMSQDIKNPQTHSHFIPLQISQNQQVFEFLLPAFNMPFSFLQQKSFYKCQNILFSFQKNDKTIDLSIFSKITTEKAFNLDGKWDWSWRKNDRGYNFGRYVRPYTDEEILLKITNGLECNFRPSDLQQYEHKPLEMKKQYSFSDILEWAQQLPSRKSERKTMEQL